MNMDRYTIKAQEALQGAQTMASKSGHPELTTAHLLLALLVQEGGLVRPVLQKIGAGHTVCFQRIRVCRAQRAGVARNLRSGRNPLGRPLARPAIGGVRPHAVSPERAASGSGPQVRRGEGEQDARRGAD